MYAQTITYTLIAVAVFLVLHLFVALAQRGKSLGRRPRWNWWERLLYLALMVTILVLAATSFYTVLTVGFMGGWALWLHLMAAGAFVVAFALIALTWGGAARSECCTGSKCDSSEATPTKPARFSCLTKLTFWLMLIAGFVVLATMLINMLPLLGTHDIERMIAIHRYAGLALVAVAVIHVYSVILGRLGLR
ncbi:MAG: hypothetical protein GC162_06325 [Planctomycetes bacterium]|nr:hypothetical protein [Planctomycetota bacterium]